MRNARGFLIVAAVVIGLLTALHQLVRPNYGERNFELLTEMVYSKAGESFAANRALPGGHTQQPLVPGVVPRDSRPLHYGAGEEEALRAGRELRSPLSPDDTTALARGRELYGIYCALCHGAGGDGDGPVSRRGMLPPPSLFALRATGMADGQMFHILTNGQGTMASYSAQLSPEERWRVVLHVRSLQEERTR